MITSLSINNFRGLKQVTLNDLRSVNLIVGGNNTGKTSVLEALVLLFGDGTSIGNLSFAFRANQSGGNSRDDHNDREHFWSWLFFDRNVGNSISVAAKFEPDATIKLESEYTAEARNSDVRRQTTINRSDSRIPTFTISGSGQEILRQRRDNTLFTIGDNQLTINSPSAPDGFRLTVLSTRPTNPALDAESFNQVALLADGERRVENLMREIEPRLTRLRYARQPGTNGHLIFADVGLSRAVPVSQMGQAFNRILHIYTHILDHRSNVVLVDEIENGIFCDAMPEVWRGLLAICEQEGVQIFATTHSRECVMAAQSIAKERGKDELCVQRLQLVKGQVEAARLGVKQLELAAEMGLEVRS